MVKPKKIEEKVEKEEKMEKGEEEVGPAVSQDTQGGPRALESGGVSRQELLEVIGALQGHFENSMEKLASQVASSTATAHASDSSGSAPPSSSAAQFPEAFRFKSISTDGRVQSSPVREASPDRFFPGFSPFSPASVGNTNISLPFGVASLPKRSENEAAVLYQIMEAAQDPDQVVRLCKRRIQILYAAESVGWREIQTYLQMFPGDTEINMSNLETAIRMSKWMGAKSSGPVMKKSPPPPESNYGASSYASKKKGNCFNCGGTGHWAGECPAPRKAKGN
jgi:hypothetical protein